MPIPVAGKLEQLFPNVHRLCAANPGPMTGPGTNTYFYGNEELAVFDPGPDLDSHIGNILAAQDTLNAPITRIFASHTHADHSPAVAVLASTLKSAEIIGLPAAAGQMFEDHTFKPTKAPNDGEHFETDAGIVTAIYTPGHVGNHVCYLIEEHGFLTTGDHLMNGSTVVIIPPKGSMKDYIESLRKLRGYKIKSIGPGHGDVIHNPVEVVDWTINHRLKREAKVVSALETDEVKSIQQLVPKVYDDVDESLHGIAALSLHAHLIKLEIENVALESSKGWSLLSGQDS